MKKTVVIGFLGTTLDAGKGPKRWERWRPTVSICMQDDLLIDRLELLHDSRSKNLATLLSEDIAQVSPDTNVRSHIVNLKDPWDFQEVYGALYEFAHDYTFRPDKEDYLAQITTGTHVAQICMYLLTESRHFPARLLQVSPPCRRREGDEPGDYAIIDLDLSKYDRIAARFEAEQQDATSFLKSGIETRSAAFNDMIDQIERVAIRSSAPVLLTGPTGAGKSQLARRIYELKRRLNQINGDFVEVNCATLRGDNTMSALFGHKKGAFTGAVSDRPGLLRRADGGMLFLDEIGELGLEEQAMILRAIEEKTFLPVGSDKESNSDFQLIAGTNRDLLGAVSNGAFREDLLARLNLWTFQMPGLKERREDIEPNLEFELTRHEQSSGRHVTFNKEARDRYLKFATSPAAVWSANFRDLGASVTRMATLCDGGRIREADVKLEIDRLSHSWQSASDDKDSQILLQLFGPERLEEIDLFDRAQLAQAIEVCRQSKSLSAAGRALFAQSRRRRASTNDADRLRKYLARFDLNWEDVSA